VSYCTYSHLKMFCKVGILLALKYYVCTITTTYQPSSRHPQSSCVHASCIPQTITQTNRNPSCLHASEVINMSYGARSASALKTSDRSESQQQHRGNTCNMQSNPSSLQATEVINMSYCARSASALKT
jgi:hypothetical protein